MTDEESAVARAPFQTLVIPYKLTEEGIRYAVFLRSDGALA